MIVMGQPRYLSASARVMPTNIGPKDGVVEPILVNRPGEHPKRAAVKTNRVIIFIIFDISSILLLYALLTSFTQFLCHEFLAAYFRTPLWGYRLKKAIALKIEIRNPRPYEIPVSGK